VIEESYESQTFEEETDLNDDGEKEVRDPNLAESPEIDPEIYLQLTPENQKRVDSWATSKHPPTPKQQKEIIERLLEKQSIEENSEGLSPFGEALQLFVWVFVLGVFGVGAVVLWNVGFFHWGSDRLTQFTDYLQRGIEDIF
tara:strand:+ start:812 stop:1237 length:426 start_codon:yes stop_codon:yes gene_type:complete